MPSRARRAWGGHACHGDSNSPQTRCARGVGGLAARSSRAAPRAARGSVRAELDGARQGRPCGGAHHHRADNGVSHGHSRPHVRSGSDHTVQHLRGGRKRLSRSPSCCRRWRPHVYARTAGNVRYAGASILCVVCVPTLRMVCAGGSAAAQHAASRRPSLSDRQRWGGGHLRILAVVDHKAAEILGADAPWVLPAWQEAAVCAPLQAVKP